MARTSSLTDFLTDVSSAIKQKTGDNTPIPASDFDTEILSIRTAGNYQNKEINITQNGNVTLLPDQGYDALSQVQITTYVSGTGGDILNTNGLDVSIDNSTLVFELPYIELEYIQSSGSQYISTGRTTTANTKIEITFQNNSTSIGYARLFGCWDKQNLEVVTNNTSPASYYFVGYNNNAVLYALDARNEFKTFTMTSNRKVEYNGQVVVSAISNYTTNMNIEIFRGFNRYGAYMLKSFKIYESDVLVLNLIPVKRRSDNVVCLYDLISKTYYTNKGSGSFTAGPVKGGN